MNMYMLKKEVERQMRVHGDYKVGRAGEREIEK